MVDACDVKGWPVLFTKTLKKMAHTKVVQKGVLCQQHVNPRCRTVTSTSHLMMAHHSTTHLLLVSRALTKRSSLHGEEYLAGENTVIEEHRAPQGPRARSG